jgi:hypothetical protein
VTLAHRREQTVDGRRTQLQQLRPHRRRYREFGMPLQALD